MLVLLGVLLYLRAFKFTVGSLFLRPVKLKLVADVEFKPILFTGTAHKLSQLFSFKVSFSTTV